ncbi:hypothetical protein [Okeania sp. SIO2B3]|uniref:hypothetical protein n=1 Tax=Okeania sp. SIO2B3 TaxID=2607784 RepID=UPI0013BF9734|nr:hypothetical protein [Okeania sp. SIO2B3]NET40849.1 hypothetical protein [Okeania sp. SIO2B3]
MGLLKQYFGNDSKKTSSKTLGSGSHAINKDDIISGGVMSRFSPDNTPDWQGIQSVPVVPSARYMTPAEAKALTAHRKQLAEAKKASRVGYQELQRIDKYDTKVVSYHSRYAKSNAREGLKQTRQLAGVGRTLHSLRPGYAGINTGLQRAENSAQQQIERIANNLKQ